MTLNSFVLKNVGEFLYFVTNLYFLPKSGVISLKPGGSLYPVGHQLLSATVLYSTNDFSVLILRVFIFF